MKNPCLSSKFPSKKTCVNAVTVLCCTNKKHIFFRGMEEPSNNDEPENKPRNQWCPNFLIIYSSTRFLPLFLCEG
jgi:hypothetical protein